MELDKAIAESIEEGKRIDYVDLDQLEIKEFCREFGYDFQLNNRNSHCFTYKDVNVRYDWGRK